MKVRAHRSRLRALMVSTALALVASAAMLSACSDDESPPPSGSTDYVGLMASTAGATGPLSITFASGVTVRGASSNSAFAVDPVNATGTFSLGSIGPIAISGTLTDGTLLMTGSGWTINGTLANGAITGTFTGPDGETGSLAAVSSTESAPARAYCGTYTGIDHTDESAEAGTFSVVLAGTVALGTVVTDDGDTGSFSGTATSTAFTVHQAINGGFLNVDGLHNATSASGTYNTKTAENVAVSEGTFNGPLCE